MRLKWGRGEAGSHNYGIVKLGVRLPSIPPFSRNGQNERTLEALVHVGLEFFIGVFYEADL